MQMRKQSNNTFIVLKLKKTVNLELHTQQKYYKMTVK